MRLAVLSSSLLLAAVAVGCGSADEDKTTVDGDAVIAALVDAAAAVDPKAVGAGCTPPPRDARMEETWDCQVTYQGSPQPTVKYRVDVNPDGCWSAEEVGGERRLQGCGLRVRPVGS